MGDLRRIMNNGEEGRQSPGWKSQADRRTFFKTAVSAGAGVVVASSEICRAEPNASKATTPIPQGEPPVDAASMPKIRIGNLNVSRLIVGANPMWGWSHRGELLGKADDGVLHDSAGGKSAATL